MNTSGNPSAAYANDPVLARAIQKVKRHVLPLFVIMFIVNYIDRVNIGFVRSHMEHDLGIGAAAYGFGAGLFFIGYALFEVPSNMLLQKVGARIWLTRIMFTWGITATLMAFIQNETHFYILRFLLGVAEAGFFPGVIYYFTRWLPGAERGKAIAIFLSGSALALTDLGTTERPAAANHRHGPAWLAVDVHHRRHGLSGAVRVCVVLAGLKTP